MCVFLFCFVFCMGAALICNDGRSFSSACSGATATFEMQEGVRPLITQCVVTCSTQMLTARGKVENEGVAALQSNRCEIQGMSGGGI